MQFEKEDLLKEVNTVMSNYIETYNQMVSFSLDDFSPIDTLIVIVDMVNGFVKFGPLSSEYVNDLVPSMSRFVDQCVEKGFNIVAYRDAHVSEAPEFRSFPEHCMKGSEESNLIEELKHQEIIEIEKNSTNGFLAANPLEIIEKGEKVKHIIVIGCVTDICVRDFAKTINKYLQENNQMATVYVAENLVDTYHIEDLHHREVEHLLALYDMHNAGIKIVKWENK
jgi:nicotinamidase-related amidase